jgi:pilus assembly protein Flp/PilA
MRAFFWKLINDKSGVTAIEYGLIAALIAVAAISIMGMLGTNLSDTFSKTGSKL